MERFLLVVALSAGKGGHKGGLVGFAEVAKCTPDILERVHGGGTRGEPGAAMCNILRKLGVL